MIAMSNELEQGLLDQGKLDKMKYEILALEQKNLNTGERTNDAMVDLVRKAIASIADQTY